MLQTCHCWPCMHPHKDYFPSFLCDVCLPELQCMQGFLDEPTLRRKAALIGRAVSRHQEQVLLPAVTFTCDGSLSGWTFVAKRVGGRGRSDYPEIQVWRPQPSSPHVYDLVSSVRVSPQATDHNSVYTHTLTSPISYQTGDVLGLYHPSSDSSAYKILSVQHGGPNSYTLQRQDSSSQRFDTQSSAVRTHREYPLVGAQASELDFCGFAYMMCSWLYR